MKKLFYFKTTLILVAFLLLSIAIATFIENSSSTEISWQLIYSSFWFEFLIIVITILMIINILRMMIKKEFKLGSFILHLAIVLIVIGGISKKHLGFQGELYLVKNEKSNVIYSKDYYMQLKAKKDKEELEYLIKGNDSFNHEFDIWGEKLVIKNKFYYQHIKQNIIADRENGYGVIDFDIISNDRRERFLFEEFGKVSLENIDIYFNKEASDLEKPYMKIVSNQNQMIHFISNIDIVSNFDELYEKNKIHEFHPGILYKLQDVSLLADEITTLGKVKTEFDKTKKGKSALFSLLKFKNTKKDLVLNESAKHYSSYKKSLFIKDVYFNFNWGKIKTKLPFSIKLNEFNIQRYYGSNIVSSYESDISIIDSNKDQIIRKNIKINEPLSYDGFTIFQTTSSMYGGTVLHVNYNPTIWLIYLGYFLLILALIINLFSKDSYFYRLKKSL